MKHKITIAIAGIFLHAFGASAAFASDDASLSNERLGEFNGIYQDYQFRSQYGLLDQSDQYAVFSSISGQRMNVIGEIATRQAGTRLKNVKATVEQEAGHSVVAKSALFLTAAYLICNGKTVHTRVAEDTELSTQTHASRRSGNVILTQKKITPLNLMTGIDYRLDGGSSSSVTASLSKEIAPHLMASVDQRREVGNSTVESTGKLVFGTSF